MHRRIRHSAVPGKIKNTCIVHTGKYKMGVTKPGSAVWARYDHTNCAPPLYPRPSLEDLYSITCSFCLRTAKPVLRDYTGTRDHFLKDNIFLGEGARFQYSGTQLSITRPLSMTPFVASGEVCQETYTVQWSIFC